ncbi:MAG: hypothetical protein AABM66_02075 [Actinomycetota bacterium]
MRRAATPGEVARWRDQLRPLSPTRADSVIRMLSEVVVDCRICGEGVRRSDSRRLVDGRLVHVRCSGVQRDMD